MALSSPHSSILYYRSFAHNIYEPCESVPLLALEYRVGAHVYELNSYTVHIRIEFAGGSAGHDLLVFVAGALYVVPAFPSLSPKIVRARWTRRWEILRTTLMPAYRSTDSVC